LSFLPKCIPILFNYRSTRRSLLVTIGVLRPLWSFNP
jgi:hypothetical protein